MEISNLVIAGDYPGTKIVEESGQIQILTGTSRFDFLVIDSETVESCEIPEKDAFILKLQFKCHRQCCVLTTPSVFEAIMNALQGVPIFRPFEASLPGFETARPKMESGDALLTHISAYKSRAERACLLCGEKTGFLSEIRLSDAYLCDDCFKKLIHPDIAQAAALRLEEVSAKNLTGILELLRKKSQSICALELEFHADKSIAGILETDSRRQLFRISGYTLESDDKSGAPQIFSFRQLIGYSVSENVDKDFLSPALSGLFRKKSNPPEFLQKTEASETRIRLSLSDPLLNVLFIHIKRDDASSTSQHAEDIINTLEWILESGGSTH